MTAFRVEPEDLEQIDQLARQYKMTRTDYLIRAALQDLPNTPTADERIDEIVERLDRIERAALGTF